MITAKNVVTRLSAIRTPLSRDTIAGLVPSDPDMHAAKPVPKSEWRLSELAFHRLLEWLDEGRNSQGERYIEIRQRLTEFFDRKNCIFPDDLADETLNRVARRLQETESLEEAVPARYCYIVARYVFLESLQQARRDPVGLIDLTAARRDQVLTSAQFDASMDDERSAEERLKCLRECLANLQREHRDLICQYYQGEQRMKIDNRRKIAARLGITMNALNIRACRVRAGLERCVKNCMGERAAHDD
jgi:DNA-directed RNA polymerase specialized sigma24 family protein